MTYENILDRKQRVIQCDHHFLRLSWDDAEQAKLLRYIEVNDTCKDTGDECVFVCPRVCPRLHFRSGYTKDKYIPNGHQVALAITTTIGLCAVALESVRTMVCGRTMNSRSSITCATRFARDMFRINVTSPHPVTIAACRDVQSTSIITLRVICIHDQNQIRSTGDGFVRTLTSTDDTCW